MADEKPYLFHKGQSGNPSGRPRMDERLKERLKDLSHEAVDVIEEIMRDVEAPRRDRIRAAEVLIERAWGKAAQPIEGGFTIDLRAELAARLDDARGRVIEGHGTRIN